MRILALLLAVCFVAGATADLHPAGHANLNAKHKAWRRSFSSVTTTSSVPKLVRKATSTVTTTTKAATTTSKPLSTTSKPPSTTTSKPSSTTTKPTTTSKSPTTTTSRPSSTSRSPITTSKPPTTTATSRPPTTTTTSRPPSTTTTTRPISTTSRPTTTTTSTKPTTTTTTSKPTSTTSTIVPVTTTSATCAPSYTGGAYTVSGTGLLPKPTAFVKRSGIQLQLAGKPYRMVGPNIYWLGLDENISPLGYPSKQRVREAMAQAVAMGANTIRAHTLGISVGNALSIEPTLDSFNSKAFDIIDYALFAAREYGLRVIMTLTDEYAYYHGGKYTFLQWLNVTDANYGAKFYTNGKVLDAFKRYINTIVTHYNPYSKTTYGQDATILAWETGNELGGYIGARGYPPLSFTDNIAGYIKSLDSDHLVIDGSNGYWNYTTKVAAPGLNSSFIDIMSDHLYPLNNPLMAKEQQLATSANKAMMIGEYDWTGLHGGSTSLADFISAVEATDYLGDLVWSLMSHDDQCCDWITHNDDYSLYVPSNDQASYAKVLQIVQHWHRMTGRAVPSSIPAVVCRQPVF